MPASNLPAHTAGTDDDPGPSASAGHVSMMNDVLISQLPHDLLLSSIGAMVRVSDANSKTLSSSLNSRGQTSSTPLSIDDIEKDDQVSTEHLRASLRILLGASHDNATLFVSIVRAKLEEPSAASFDDLESLFAEPGPSQSLIDLLSMTRIRLTAGVVVPAFDLFAVLPFGVTERRIRIRPGNLRSKLVEGGGDMVQAAQAFKESGDRSEKAKSSLMNLIDRLLECREYCLSSDCFFPFARAVPQMIDTAQLVFKSSIKAFHIPEYTTVHQVRRCPKPLPQIQLGRLEVPRLFFGLWQLSSPAWGSASHEEIIEGMGEMISNGLVAADMADHYADAELIFGQFRKHSVFDAGERETIICATKYCQFARVPTDEVVDRDWVMRKVRERTDRIGGTVQLLQVHWQHLDDDRYLDVFSHLLDIAHTHPDLLCEVGLCNFDAKTTERICAHLLKTRGSVGVVSNQVQYSLIDQRPHFAMAEVCRKYGVKLVTYGTFCGGFLADRWVGANEPDMYSGGLNTSQRKYYDMIRAWGGWELLQQLLVVLKEIAGRRGVDVSNVAARWVLERPETGVVIVGSRLGVASHIPSTVKTLDFEFTQHDRADIERVIANSRVQAMFEQIGDCGSEYR